MDAVGPLYFGRGAADYAASRPPYPDALFAWLADVAPARRLAWDCGAGSGQATIGLSPRFDRVLATEADARQLALAPRLPNVEFRLASAEADPGLRGEVDLVACACSIHWFALEPFYDNVRRALAPKGVIAAWTYDWPWTGREALDRVLHKLRDDILGDLWDENARFYFGRYRDLPFPFTELACPRFEATIGASLDQLTRFLKTWSAVEKYRARRGRDPIDLIRDELVEAWRADPPSRPLLAPLHMRCGFQD
jgi:SAM-dependent methyltransferase